jgi:hypothetical protein
MTELQASRTLVKSPPELWAECSDAATLARHLGQFGEIRITRLEPETAVAWEGERARGTVRIEPAGWGTKVILTAVAHVPDVAEPAEISPPPPRARFPRIRAFLRRSDRPPVGPAPPSPGEDTEAALAEALDSLGQAHHRPFSRA